MQEATPRPCHRPQTGDTSNASAVGRSSGRMPRAPSPEACARVGRYPSMTTATATASTANTVVCSPLVSCGRSASRRCQSSGSSPLARSPTLRTISSRSPTWFGCIVRLRTISSSQATGPSFAARRRNTPRPNRSSGVRFGTSAFSSADAVSTLEPELAAGGAECAARGVAELFDEANHLGPTLRRQLDAPAADLQRKTAAGI